METDFQAMTRLFNSLGINHVAETGENTLTYDYLPIDDKKFNQSIRIDEGAGYPNFYTEFFFLDGMFVGHGVWE